jgi:hypothetical protein
LNKLKKMRHDLLNHLAAAAGAMELEMWELALKSLDGMRACIDDMEKEIRVIKK